MLPRFIVQLLAVALKEIRHTVRDKRMMALLLVAPALQLGVFGFAVDFDVDRVPTVTVDHDHSATSRHHLSRLLADGTLVYKFEVASDEEARTAIDRNDVSVAVIVPRGFGEALGSGRVAHLQVMVDGTDPNRGAVAAAAVARYARAENITLSERLIREQTAMARTTTLLDSSSETVLPKVTSQPVFLSRVLHNPRLRTATYMVPGIIALLLLVVTVIVTAMGLARERETGTLEQVLVTPMSPIVLLTGKLLPYVFIGLFDFLFAIVVARGSSGFRFTVSFVLPSREPARTSFARWAWVYSSQP